MAKVIGIDLGTSSVKTILIDENTKNLIENDVITEYYKNIQPKGFSRPLETFTVKDFNSSVHIEKRKKLYHKGKRVEINVIDSSDIRAAIEELKRIQKEFETNHIEK